MTAAGSILSSQGLGGAEGGMGDVGAGVEEVGASRLLSVVVEELAGGVDLVPVASWRRVGFWPGFRYSILVCSGVLLGVAFRAERPLTGFRRRRRNLLSPWRG